MAKKQFGLIFEPEVKAPADFILVQKKIIPEEKQVQINKFLMNLKKAGLAVEIVDGVKYTDYYFVKLKASEESLKHLSSVHGLFPTYQHDKTMPHYTTKFKCFKTQILLKPNLQDPMFQRCSNSVRGDKNVTFTSAERILLINAVLSRTTYGLLKDEFGLGNLLASKHFEDAYPLHDGSEIWTKTGPLNDRQFLARFWGNWRMFYKLQPIHIIYKYYGSEIAFHFAWMEFYTKCLVIPALFGVIVFLVGNFDLFLSGRVINRVREVCYSKMKICPPCTFRHCRYKEFDEFCDIAKTSFLLDNNYTISFSIFITIWATFLLEFWARQENILTYQWNLHKSTPQVDELPNYKERVSKYKKYNKYTHTEEYYTPFCLKFWRNFLSFIVVFVLVLLITATALAIMISEHFIEYNVHKHRIGILIEWMSMIMKLYSALVTIVIMKLYAPGLDKTSEKLTNNEIHRTQDSYMTSYIFKSYILNFFNTYLMLIYVAFFKDLCYTNPSDHGIYNKFFGVASNLCPPAVGCIDSLSTLISFTILRDYILILLFNSYRLINLYGWIKKCCSKVKKAPLELTDLPQWEVEFSLIPSSELFFAESLMVVILEYGLLTFFVGVVPLVPLLALINNIVELRVTAYTLVKKTRRNVSKRVLGLGAWKTVLLVVTRISYLVSGCIICFTSTFVHRTVYYNERKTMVGFVNDTLSVFLVDHFRDDMESNIREKYPDVKICFYPGNKNSYNHTKPYQLSDRHFELVSIKFLAIVAYIHIVYFINAILSYLIPKMPAFIEESLFEDDKAKRMKELDKISKKEKK
ncbi:anoctamin-4-like isoform X2 [Onthophagus taurus]|uniref:anoctamin-4-like isoform X2 n=1 Tax=Onthophagus taurus TaxID=166361 RepID=UPI0039BE7BDF